MNQNCANCGKKAIQVCIHQQCDVLPFMCGSSDCQFDTTVDKRLYHVHNEQTKFAVWEAVVKKSRDITEIFDTKHQNQVEKEIEIIIGDLRTLILRYQEVLKKSTFEISFDVQNVMNKIEKTQHNADLTGKELSLFLNSNEVREHRIKDKRDTILIRKQMENIIQALKEIQIESFFNSQSKVNYKKKAIECSNNGNFQDAIQNLRMAKKCDPLDPKFVQSIGFNYYLLKNYEQSFKYFEDSIKMGITGYDLALSYFNLGVLYEAEGKPTKASKQYSKAILADSNYADAYFHRGNTEFNYKRYQEAIKDYSEAIKINPEETRYRLQLEQAEQCLKNQKLEVNQPNQPCKTETKRIYRLKQFL